MRNNTLAIALAAMLVGGVATAGFINNRAQSQSANVATYAAQPVTQLALDRTVPAPPRVEYADVLNVQPVQVREHLHATVIGSEPLRETSTTSTPHQVCEDVAVVERMPERDGNVGGTVAGTLIGGLVGNQIGGGNGKKAATVAGAVAGGVIGNRVDRRHVGGQVVNRTDRRCRTVQHSSTSSRAVAWNVTYRNPDGTTGTMRTERKPGSSISLGDVNRTVGYDVTYRLDGRTHNVRMDQAPGPRLPVIDGQVVTQVAAVADNRNG